MKELVRFQTDRYLDTKPFELQNEVANIFEELLEAGGLDVAKADRPALKAELQLFIDGLMSKNIATNAVIDVDAFYRVDAFADIITFAAGALLKLGHDPLIAIEECGKEINSRVGEMLDGKFEKDLSMSHLWYKADYNRSEL